MDIRVNEPGCRVLAAAVDHPGPLGDSDRSPWADLCHPVPPDQDRRVRDGRPAVSVNHGNPYDRRHLLGGLNCACRG